MREFAGYASWRPRLLAAGHTSYILALHSLNIAPGRESELF